MCIITEPFTIVGDHIKIEGDSNEYTYNGMAIINICS